MRIALIDLDRTTADFDGAMNKALDSMASPQEPNWRTYSTDDPWLASRITTIMRSVGFWESLEPIPLGLEVVSLLQRIGYHCKILSKVTKQSPNAWTEKARWSKRYLPGLPIILTEDKSGELGDVLFDDSVKYYKAWLANNPSSTVISPAYDFNAVIPDECTNKVIRIDNNFDRAELKKLLEKIYYRS